MSEGGKMVAVKRTYTLTVPPTSVTAGSDTSRSIGIWSNASSALMVVMLSTAGLRVVMALDPWMTRAPTDVLPPRTTANWASVMSDHVMVTSPSALALRSVELDA
jgi:hypothetical protein